MIERIKLWGVRSTRWGILGTLTFFFAFPFVWMLITTFKRTSDLYDLKHNPFLFYEWPTLEHIHRLFYETLYGQWLLNTAFVGVLVVLITLTLAVPAGYALARLTGNWGAKLGIGIFLTYLVPPTLLFIPLSRVVVNLNLDDSLWSLVLVYPSFTVPFSAWLMMGFFKAIPKDVEEAAMIDGCSRLGAFIKVVVPISLSGILTVAIFSFTLVIAGICIRRDFYFFRAQYDRRRRRADFLSARRRLFLGLVDGRLLHRQRADRNSVQFLRRSLYRRLHHGRGQVAIDAANHVLMRYKIYFFTNSLGRLL